MDPRGEWGIETADGVKQSSDGNTIITTYWRYDRNAHGVGHSTLPDQNVNG